MLLNEQITKCNDLSALKTGMASTSNQTRSFFMDGKLPLQPLYTSFSLIAFGTGVVRQA
jgi:hypothetical protein